VKERELYAYRRHLRTCPFFGPGGREIRADRCNCPFHTDGSTVGYVFENRCEPEAANLLIDDS